MMNFIDYQNYSKEYRNKNDITLLKKLIFDFKDEYQNLLNNTNVFDKIAYHNMLFFLLTQKYKTETSIFKNKLNDSDVNIIHKEFNKIRNEYVLLNKKSKDINNKDYHYVLVYNKAIKKTLEILKRHLETNSIDVDQQKNNKDINFIKEIRKSFVSSIDVYRALYNNSKKKNHVPIYAPFEQCRTRLNIISLNGESFNIRLFIDSSHVLPLDYKTDEIIFDKLIDDIKNLFSEINLVISENNKKYYHEFLKASLEKSQHNSIQVIAIFSGLIAFITATSSAISNKEYNIRNIILFLIAFSLMYGVFILILREVIKESRFTTVIIVMIIILLILYGIYNKDVVDFLNITNKT